MYEFTEQCTIWLQMESVIKCAKSLGYEFNGRAFYTRKRLFTNVYDNFNKRIMCPPKTYFLSFNDMQVIHNTGAYDSITLPIQPVQSWSYSEYIAAVPADSKLVEESYLQYNKKLKCFQTTKNMVRFV